MAFEDVDVHQRIDTTGSRGHSICVAHKVHHVSGWEHIIEDADVSDTRRVLIAN